MTTIYNQALESIKNNKVNATLYTGQAKHVFLSQSNGAVFLVYQECNKRNLVQKTEQVKCAFYNPRRGWTFSLDRDVYADWVAKTGNKVSKPKKSIVQPLADWAKTPGGQAYMDLPPDADLVQEIAKHNRTRAAGRNTSQPVWDGWRRRSRG